MATTGRAESSAPAASDVAADCREAGLVRLVGARRGDALAAVGLLAGALDGAAVPYQAGLRQWPDGGEDGTDADVRLAVGLGDPSATHALVGTPVESAYEIAEALADADPVLGLAGVLALDGSASGRVREDAMARGVERRPGLAIPTADPADGLAHSTLVHGPFSGDRAAAADALEDLDEDVEADGTRLPSAVALAVGADAPAGSRAGTAIERFLRPHAGGPLETLGGYADVLDALARRDPGLGLATALGHTDEEAALEAWRDHGSEIHRGVASADRRRHDGTETATVDEVADAAVEPVARLLRDFRAVEPAVLVRGDGRAALATRDGLDARALLETALDGREASLAGDGRLAATTAADEELASAVREAVGRGR